MSKMSKTIAILGVVAGLGVAALPLSSYAVANETTRVTDNADENTANSNQTGEVQSKDTEVTVKVESTLSIATDVTTVPLTKDNNFRGDVNVNVVSMLNTNPYVLSIKQGSTGSTLAADTTESADAQAKPFVAFSKTTLATGDALVAEGGSSTWGYSLDGAKFAGVTANATDGILKTQAVVDDSSENDKYNTGTAGEDTKVTFGAALVAGQPNGTYKGNVVFVASVLGD